MTEPETRLMPIVGGDRHGHVMDIKTSTYLRLEFTDDNDLFSATAVTYTAKSFLASLPGRTDRQWFRVLVHPDVGDDAELAWNAVIHAWADGWAPPDENSEARHGAAPWNPKGWRW